MVQYVRYVLLVLVFLAGCAPKEPPPVPVPPMPTDLSPVDDLSTWAAPTLIEPPPAPAPLPSPRPAADNEVLYVYEPSKEYVVDVPLGWPADVVLEPGEKVHNIVGGDRVPLQEGEAPRWEVKEGVSESQYTAVQHIFLTASHVGQKMGVIVTTSRRTYYLTVKSVAETPIRAVRWAYPAPPVPPVVEQRPFILPDTSKPQRYHVGYLIDALDPAPDWTPFQVLDDGRKTYILFPPTMLYQEAPLLRLIGPQGPQLVNSRQYKTVYIIDQLISRAELRLGAGEHAQLVTITRGALHTVVCPGQAPEWCPQWPTEPRVRGRAN